MIVHNIVKILYFAIIICTNMYTDAYLLQNVKISYIKSYHKQINIFDKITKSNSKIENIQFKRSTTAPYHTNTQIHLFPTSTYPFFKEAIYINGLGAVLLILLKQNSLTLLGLWHATLLGIGLWTFLDFRGWFVCVSYLILGSLVTMIKIKEKEKLGIAEKRGGKRSSENVWGSAATAMVCALCTYFYPKHSSLFKIGYVASIATKLSDTFGSELGKAYGRNTYLITTLRRVPKGTEGAVSMEGTLAGVLGSILISLLAYGVGILTRWNSVIYCIISAFVATTIESYIGAVFQDKITWLNNELVNLIMTVIGALTAISIGFIMQ